MSHSQRTKVTNTIIFIALAIGAIVMIAPLLWMLSTSVKEKQDVFALPPVWIPEVFQFSKYKEIWEAGPLLSGIKNSVIVAVSVTVIGTFTSSVAAFAFAKLRFPHKNKLFLALIASMMIPYPTVMIPQFMMFSKLGWVDTLLPLIVPGLFGNVVMIFSCGSIYLAYLMPLSKLPKLTEALISDSTRRSRSRSLSQLSPRSLFYGSWGFGTIIWHLLFI